MINRRPYIAESVIKPGRAVVQGSADNKVKAPASDGGGDFIGIYSFEANEEKKANQEIGIVISGIAKAVAGENVTAGKKAILKADDSGTLVNLPETEGNYSTVGLFLESGFTGEYIDVLIERGNITIQE